jgi:hypothetical protein
VAGSTQRGVDDLGHTRVVLDDQNAHGDKVAPVALARNFGSITRPRYRSDLMPPRLRCAIRRSAAAACAVSSLVVASHAHAYRPFDGTDAAVAEPLKLELEIGPVGYYRQGGAHYVVAPASILNFGIFPRAELVLQGFDFIRVDEASPPPRVRFVDTGAFLKSVWREGCLQNASGLSIASEVGPLLPTVNGEKGFGAYAGGIFTQCWDGLIVHFNGVLELQRETQSVDLFGGIILEGPQSRLVVRPVAELFVEHDFGGVQTYSALLGVIWKASEKLSLDSGLRVARINDDGVGEVRAGFTLLVP